MKATVLTLFPEMFPGPLGCSLSGKALAAGKWSLEAVNIRDFAQGRHKTVDDTPFGGGPGMVLRPDVLGSALDHVLSGSPPPVRRLIYLTPKGEPFTQAKAASLAQEDALVLLCGHYEGVDQRILEAYPFEEISLGDFVLSGGEMAALTVLDAVVRLLPEVIGDAESLSEESFEHGLLEYPHYTRPQEFRGLAVPDVLLSGHHAEIASWRRRQSETLTQKKRPDLWNSYCNSRK